MATNRTSAQDLIAEALASTITALGAADVDAEVSDRPLSIQYEADFGLDLQVDDRAFCVLVRVKSYCTTQVANQLVNSIGPTDDPSWFFVADRITSEARTILTDAGWSWLDRRGWLHVRGPAIRIDMAVPSTDNAKTAPSGPPIRGRSGITIAYWLCAHPGQHLSPNGSSKLLRLAPSTISTTVRSLVDDGLVDESGAAIAPELFWELAAVWRTEKTWLLRAPPPADYVSLDPAEPSWRITGTAAAAQLGAPIAAAGKGPIELYVRGPVDVSIAARRYGATEAGTGAAVISVPPTTLVNELVGELPAQTVRGWPVAPMVAVALDLAQDRSRGREILDDWDVDHGIWT